jgi:hypothetical protein
MSGDCGAQRHGDYNAYRRGCRCDTAREDRRLYYKRWHEGRLKPGMVPSAGSVRRLQALAALGWNPTQLAERMGTNPENVQNMRRGRSTEVTRMLHDRVAAVYDELQGTPGPSASTRSWAERFGWAPPLAWDDDTIDNAAARPNFGDRPDPRRRIDLDDLERFKAAGGTEADYAATVGAAPDSISRARLRERQRAHQAMHDNEPVRWSSAPSMQRALTESFGRSA